MTRLSSIAARLRGLHQLREVVGASRSLAAAHLQRASEALPAARRYRAMIDGALDRCLLLSRTTSSGATGPTAFGIIAFTSEHGFVGGFDQHVADTLKSIAPDRLFVVGTRGAAVLREAGLAPDWWGPAAVDVGTVMDVARRVTDEVYTLFETQALGRLDMVFGRSTEEGHWGLTRETLLPVEGRAGQGAPRDPPLHYLPTDDLLERLLEEHLLADVVRGTTEALAAENLARLHAMSAAHDAIVRRTRELEAMERLARQDQVTEELLDLISEGSRPH